MQTRSTGLLALLFGLSAPVSRRTYVAAGLALGLLKVAVEVLLVRLATGSFEAPFAALWPLGRGARATVLAAGSPWLSVALGLWTLPFAWIGASMSVRRALDAGRSPWIGLLFFVPLVNYAAMALLAVLPRRASGPVAISRERFQPASAGELVRSALLAAPVGVALGVGGTLLFVHVGTSYGLALFVGTPLLLGVVAARLHNAAAPRGTGSTVAVALLALAGASLALLLLALEGAVCLVMAMPLAIPLTLAGALLGQALVPRRPARGRELTTLGLAPLLLATLDLATPEPRVHEVVTSIEVEAAPEEVWPHVVAFAELPPPRRWIFRTGIAYPVRASIDGSGVGAVRRCEFSTGAFVEPITRWEPPARLSFDVAAQPDPMREWTLREGLRPPHLEIGFRSLRGEFRLVPLPGGRTRLEGSTWYRLDLHPTWYWRAVAEPLLHAIHRRVLEHVAARSEA